MGHFSGMVHRIREWYVWYKRMGLGEVVNEIVLKSVRPEGDVRGVE